MTEVFELPLDLSYRWVVWSFCPIFW